MIYAVCLAVLAALPAAEPAVPPLTEPQLTQVRELVRVHRKSQTESQAKLTAAQAALAACYARDELDLAAIAAHEEEIIAAQRKLLAGHRTLQIELRKIVGPERLKILLRRLENAARPAKETAP